ncbi:peptide ABC transporter permease [Rhodovibrio sodomensis]|uniref:Peptide ABC transporter permease n=1 Tax=Rhodovibrio sodomensis TaxID=1088 RepID=A0ABS1DE38_9PROT|nr:ABC transporter permease [Rhodovibrio sodomensis]MBK1668149.1 peptide ABC transporter permease [Rhodovibrio sodomensis]
MAAPDDSRVPRRPGLLGRQFRRVSGPIKESRGLPRVVLWIGTAITGMWVLVAIFAPWIAPYGYAQYQTAAGERFPKHLPPNMDHLLGTTVQSTDVFSRIIWGARTEVEVVILAVLFSLAIGLPVGLISGFKGGWLDRVLVLIMDALFAFPYLLLAIVIAFLLSDVLASGVLTAAIAISVVYVPQYFRVVRNHTISVREEPFVEAARAMGARPRWIVTKYVFANVVQSVPVVATLNAADSILTLAGLGFLGYGIQPTQGAEWGYDLQRAIADAGAGIWWTGLFPGIAIVSLVTGLTLLGEGLNDVLNPLLRPRRTEPVKFPDKQDDGAETGRTQPEQRGKS